MLIFIVVQAQSRKKTGTTTKESVSIKILLNHIQMLALLASTTKSIISVLISILDLGGIWTNPFLGLLLVGGTATLVDQRVVNWDCALQVGYYTKYIFFMIIPWITVAACTIIYTGILAVRLWLLPLIARLRSKEINCTYSL